MRVIHGLENLGAAVGPVAMTIGNFDGLHLGHQDIIRQVVSLAGSQGLVPTVLTFEYHPLRLLAPDRAPGLLMPMEQKLERLEALGPKLVVIARCTHELLDLEPRAFVRDVLLRHFQVRYIVEGPNFRFGHDRAGSIDLLVAMQREYGFEAVKREPIRVDLPGRGGVMLSSSLVRRLLQEGSVDLAARCLGRPYELIGEVVSGDGRGRALGFPTANLQTPQLLPASGVYAARARIDGVDHQAAVHLGPAPTFEHSHHGPEVYVLNFDGDLYGRRLGVKLIRRIRGTERFADAAALVERMRRDVREVRSVLAEDNSSCEEATDDHDA